ncbi:MAG: hypothetical protein ACKPKO_52350, partial [Candidatus Fonsibacter sp.]
PSGRITAHPTEVDRIAQQAWTPVYRGHEHAHSHIVGDFLAKYKDFIYRGEPFPVSDITGERLRRELKHAAATAASWDQWEHQEWAIMPDSATDWRAKLLNLVEQGSAWPSATTWGKSFFLSKTD